MTDRKAEDMIEDILKSKTRENIIRDISQFGGDSIGLTRELPAKLASIQVVLEELTGNNIKLEIIRKRG